MHVEYKREAPQVEPEPEQPEETAPAEEPEPEGKSVVEWAWAELKYASPDPNAAKLRNYWAHEPEGRAKWRPGTPGDFDRLVRQLRKYVKNPQVLKGLAANIHKLATGTWPGRNAHKSAFDWLDTESGDVMTVSELAELKAARAEIAELLGEDVEVKAEGFLSEDELFEQALADDVEWEMEPDGTLTSEEGETAPEPTAEEGEDPEPELEQAELIDESSDGMQELFDVLAGGKG